MPYTGSRKGERRDDSGPPPSVLSEILQSKVRSIQEAQVQAASSARDDRFRVNSDQLVFEFGQASREYRIRPANPLG